MLLLSPQNKGKGYALTCTEIHNPNLPITQATSISKLNIPIMKYSMHLSRLPVTTCLSP